MKRLLFLVCLGLTLVPAWARAAEALLITNLVDPAQALAIAKSYSIRYIDNTPGGPFVLYGVDEARKEQVEQEMMLDPRVVWVEDDLPLDSPEGAAQRPHDIRGRVGSTIPAIFDTGHGVAFNQDYLKQIKWRPTLLVGGLDREVRVAVLDTGLSPRQPVLWRNVIATYDALGTGSAYDWPAGVDTNGNGEFDEAVGHGTFVTSIIATVAPYAKIAVARVADSDGIATSWSMIKGLVFAVNNGCEIANVSLGSADQPAALGDVIEWADGMGLVVVAGSGNDSTDRALYPSRFSEVIGVSGVDAKYRKSDFSNWDGHLRQAAPSVSIAGAWWKGGMMGWSGTSFASPFVAGCLADTARKRAVWTPDQVRSLLDTVGQNIDQFNPLYAGELGLLVDWQALLNAQATVPTIYATRR